jgi:tetratricopeptide (TPR) repeat protein
VKSLYRLNDGNAQSKSEVTALIEQAQSIDAQNAEIFAQLADLSVLVGNPDEAATTLRLAVELAPCEGAARGKLLGVLHDAKQPYERFEMARQGVLQCPELASALNDMAWVYATSRVAELRDGEQAVDLAERALAAEPKGPGRLGIRDTLAAAQAETGHYERAAAIIAEIIPELEQMGVPRAAIAEFEEHLAEFEAGRPLRD